MVIQQLNAYRRLINVTGAFLQFILVLTAVASRLHVLLDELGSAVDQCASACTQLIAILDPSAVAPSTIHSKRLLDDRSPQADSDDAKEYIGQSVTPGEQSRASSRPQSHPPEDTIVVDSVQSFDFGFGAKTDNFKANTPDKPTIVRSSVKRVESSNPASREGSVKRKVDMSKTHVPKKKKKKDEIDDIFGF
ncbi:hypothetical protein EIP86_004132 [Pleurotus ostreatoroseus]|nr:hypothetical protein EIP86_004132 [Pleurotus ostreatoroseus]